MVKLIRLVAVAAGVGLVGLLLTAVAFQLLHAAQSDEGMLGLASALAVGNFYLLRHGLRWALRPVSAVIEGSDPVEESSRGLVLHPTH